MVELCELIIVDVVVDDDDVIYELTPATMTNEGCISGA
jgi:hypothetical protein